MEAISTIENIEIQEKIQEQTLQHCLYINLKSRTDKKKTC
jgi:hypothetical protein